MSNSPTDAVPDLSDAALIEVCDKCLRACCWHGEFMCDEARLAGTIYKTRRELLALNLEHPSYWDRDEPKADQ